MRSRACARDLLSVVGVSGLFVDAADTLFASIKPTSNSIPIPLGLDCPINGLYMGPIRWPRHFPRKHDELCHGCDHGSLFFG